MNKKISKNKRNLFQNKTNFISFIVLLLSIFWLKEVNYLFYNTLDSPDINKYIIYILHQGSDHLNSKFSKKITKNRIFYSVCVGTLFTVSVIHYIIDGIDMIIYLCSTIFYLIGIVIISFDTKNRTCIRLRCFKQAKWQQLKDVGMDFIDEDPNKK